MVVMAVAAVAFVAFAVVVPWGLFIKQQLSMAATHLTSALVLIVD